MSNVFKVDVTLENLAKSEEKRTQNLVVRVVQKVSSKAFIKITKDVFEKEISFYAHEQFS